MTYATSSRHALISRALYLPEGCAADEEHREMAGVPDEVMFASKPRVVSSGCQEALRVNLQIFAATLR